MATEAPTKRIERWPDFRCGTWWYCRDCWIAHLRDHRDHRLLGADAPAPAPSAGN